MIYGYILYITIYTLVLSKVSSNTLLNQLNFYASLNPYTVEMFQMPFSIENFMTASLELAGQSCQESFQWQRWNCPSTDFLRRHSAKSVLFDREDAYVSMIITTALLYTITKSCASGVVSDCGCNTSECSDDLAQAERLYEGHLDQLLGKGPFDRAREHNHRAALNLLRDTKLQRQCGCRTLTANGKCTEEVCRNVLPPFKEIALYVKRMYNQGLQLDRELEHKNTRVLWSNVPLNALVFVKESPNYCEPDAVPLWNGIQGRLCSPIEQSDSCVQLCEVCGLSVRTRDVVLERSCYCHFSPWTFQIQCDRCVGIEQQHYCN